MEFGRNWCERKYLVGHTLPGYNFSILKTSKVLKTFEVCFEYNNWRKRLSKKGQVQIQRTALDLTESADLSKSFFEHPPLRIHLSYKLITFYTNCSYAIESLVGSLKQLFNQIKLITCTMRN